MSRKIGSPSKTYIAMPFVGDNVAGGRGISNNSFQYRNNNHNHVNVSAINSQLSAIHACNSIDSPGPLRKLEPPDAPHPNQEFNQLNGYNKTGQQRDNILRITKDITLTRQKNYQVHQSNDLPSPKPSTSKSVEVPKAKIRREIPEKRTNQVCVNVCDSDSSSDLSDSSYSSFFKKRKNYNRDRLAYTGAEDLEILNFVLIGDNIYRTSSISLWKELESEKTNPKRTFHSLKNRFMRNIKPFIFTKYGKFLTAEKTKMLTKKFPELSRRKKSETHSCIPIQRCQKKEPLRPCLEKKEVCIQTQNSALPPSGANKKPGIVRAFKDVSVGTENEIVDLVSSPGEDVGNNSKSIVAPIPRIELNKKEELKDVICQTFEYSAALCSFKKEAAVNLNLILMRNPVSSGEISKRSLLNEADKPVNVRVTVSISTGAVKRKLKRCGRREKKIKKRLENIYFLKLRKRTGRTWKRKARKYKEAAKILFSAIEKRKNEKNEGRRKGSNSEDEVHSMVLRSQTQSTETQEEERGSMTGFESSSDDGSCFSEARRKVESMYKVVILPSSEVDGSQDSDVWKNGKEKEERTTLKTSDQEGKKTGLLNNMMGQMSQKGQNVKR